MAQMKINKAIDMITHFAALLIMKIYNVANYLPNVKDHRAGVAGSGASPCWAEQLLMKYLIAPSAYEPFADMLE